MTFLLLNNFVSETCLIACVWLRSNINKARGELVPMKCCVHSSTTAIYRETLVSLTTIAVAAFIYAVVYFTLPSVPIQHIPFHNDRLTMNCRDLERSSRDVIVKISAIPYVGREVVQWVWGGFAVDNATLTRFFALHFLTPFVIAAMLLIHLLFLHQTGSNNPLGLNKNTDKVPFHPYFTVRDIVGFAITLTALTLLTLKEPTS